VNLSEIETCNLHINKLSSNKPKFAQQAHFLSINKILYVNNDQGKKTCVTGDLLSPLFLSFSYVEYEARVVLFKVIELCRK
jgi:hypothetical protein